MTPSIDAYLLKNNSAKFCPDAIWDDKSVTLFWRRLPQKEKEYNSNKLLPDKTDHAYNLRLRCHSFSLTT